MTTYLKFPNEAAAIAALPQFRTDDAWTTHHGANDIDLVGVIHKPTGETLDADDGPMPELAPLDGWHVNLAGPVPHNLKPFVINPPSAPVRVFAGD